MRNKEVITLEDLDNLRRQGAVGDISLHFYDINGKEVDSEFHNRVIGVSFEALKKIPRVVGIAGGPEKYRAVLGALQGGVINTLITEKETAQKLLQEK
jgi:DNA-binding transcriptional regulator LsrR (DeoR family)